MVPWKSGKKVPARSICPAGAYPAIMRVLEYSEGPNYTLQFRRPARSPTCRCSPHLLYTSHAECIRLKATMRQHSVQYRTGRTFGKGAPAHRAVPRRRRAGRQPAVTRRRAAIAAGRRRRRLLCFFAVTACVVGELAAAVIDKEALMLLFSLSGLFLCAVILQTSKY
jgi:hypothetical protein